MAECYRQGAYFTKRGAFIDTRLPSNTISLWGCEALESALEVSSTFSKPMIGSRSCNNTVPQPRESTSSFPAHTLSCPRINQMW